MYKCQVKSVNKKDLYDNNSIQDAVQSFESWSKIKENHSIFGKRYKKNNKKTNKDLFVQ